MTAAYRLRGLGWFAGGVVVTLAFYLVSLQVAAERKRLEHVNADIATTQRDIRALETEFDTRANMAQLERWNGDTLGLVAPTAAQFVPDAARLASLDARSGPPAAGPDVKQAALIVPSLATPTAVAAVTAAPTPHPAPARAAPARVETAAATPPRAPAPIRAALKQVKVTPEVERAAESRPTVAMLDRKLLSDSTLSDLISAARAEKARRR